MAKVLVTGGCGFIGSHLVDALLARGDDVVVIDNLSTGKKENLSHIKSGSTCTVVAGDVLDSDLLQKNMQDVETVFHLAARISVPESIQQPVSYVETNTIGTLNILEACRVMGVKNFIFSSSAAVYGDSPATPKQEIQTPSPQSPYAVTKLDGEFYGNLYQREYGIHATSLRYFNVFGPRQDPLSPYASVIPLFIENARKNKDIIVYGDGEQTRDFIFVNDIVNANIAASTKAGGVFNVSTGQGITVNELATLIIELTHSKSKVIHQDMRPGDIKHSQGDNHLFLRHANFCPQFTLLEGLKKTVLM